MYVAQYLAQKWFSLQYYWKYIFYILCYKILNCNNNGYYNDVKEKWDEVAQSFVHVEICVNVITSTYTSVLCLSHTCVTILRI